MDVTTRTETTYVVAMTETQATALLQLAVMDPDYCQIDLRDDGTIEQTLNDLRQGLLNAGALLAGPKQKD